MSKTEPNEPPPQEDPTHDVPVYPEHANTRGRDPDHGLGEAWGQGIGKTWRGR